MKRVTGVLLLIILIGSAGSLFAQNSDGTASDAGDAAAAIEPPGRGLPDGSRLQIRAGLTWQGQGVDTSVSGTTYPDGISASELLYFLGAGMQIPFSRFAGIFPSIDLLLDEYIYLDSYGQAFITQAQTGGTTNPLAQVLGVGVNLPWYMNLPLSEKVRFDFAAGLELLFRIPIYALDGSSDIGKIGAYTMGEGRFINLYLEPGLGFAMTDNFGFSLSVRTLLPVWHLWDSTSLPFYDTLFAGVVLGFNINL